MADKKTVKEKGQLDKIEEKVDEVLAILNGDASEERIGLMERMRNAENYITFQKRALFGIVAFMGVDALARLWKIIFP